MFSKLRSLFVSDLEQRSKSLLEEMFIDIPPELVKMRNSRSQVYQSLREVDFIEKVSTWWRPTLDASWFALKTLDLIGMAEGAVKFKKDLVCFRDTLACEDGGYMLHVNAKCGSIHALHSALGLTVNLFADGQVDWTKSYGRAFYQSNLGRSVDDVIDFLKHHYKMGGFVEHMGCRHPSVNATASALWCIWQLEAWDIVDFDEIYKFVRSMLVINHESVGFKNQADDPMYVCSTYYAFRILYTLYSRSQVRNELHDEILSYRRGIRRFVLKSLSEGGFAASPELLPTIVHTKDALSLFKDKYELNFSSHVDDSMYFEVSKRVEKLIDSSSLGEFKNVAGFMDLHKYFPNIYATLLVAEIRMIFSTSFTAKGENRQNDGGELFTGASRGEIFKFVNSCYNADAGAFRCYSYDRAFIPESFFSSRPCAA